MDQMDARAMMRYISCRGLLDIQRSVKLQHERGSLIGITVILNTSFDTCLNSWVSRSFLVDLPYAISFSFLYTHVSQRLDVVASVGRPPEYLILLGQSESST